MTAKVARLELKPSPVAGVRIVDVGLRCVACHTEWRGQLDPFGEVDPVTARCPRCRPPAQPARSRAA